MGVATSRSCFSTKRSETASRELKAAVLVRESEIEELKRIMQQASWEHERLAAAFASKEAAWERERRRQEKEAARLRKTAGGGEYWRGCLAGGWIAECVKEEQARREEAVGKWKQLYLAIKTELDDLIQRTRDGERFGWGVQESMIDRLQEELRESKETVEALRSCVAVMQMEAARRDREIDLLRQSLRILGSTKRDRPKKKNNKNLKPRASCESPVR